MARSGPGRRLLDAAAGLAVGLVVVVAALVPAITAGVGGTTVVRGDVSAGGTPLPFYPVGFWSPTQGSVTTTDTDSAGRFSMELPDGVDGFAYAGSQPDAEGAISTQDGRTLVRGVIGEEAPRATSHPLYQGWSSATAHALGAGHDLEFHLQAAGRISGIAPSAGGGRVPVELRRLDGSVVQRMSLDAQGRFTSMSVVPGDYAVVSAPTGTYLPAAARVTVAAGRTLSVTVPQPPQGATLSGRITSNGVVAGGVPVLVEQGGLLVARATSVASGRSTGTYSIGGLAAGEYTVSYGRTAIVGASERTSVPVAIPGETPTPTPSASASAATTGSAAPGTQIVPVRQTADAVLPVDTTVTVDDALDPVLQDEELAPAAIVSGHVTGAAGATVRVVAEDPTTGQVVRATTAAADGTYHLGGLTPDRPYRIDAATDPAADAVGLAGESSLTVTAAGSTVDVALAEAAGVVAGTVTGATGGTVRVGDAAGLLRTGTIGRTGAYRVTGLPPGTYPLVVAASGRIASTPQLVQVQSTAGAQSGSAAAFDPAIGPRPATFKAWYIANSAGVPRISGSAVDDAGDVVSIGPETDGGIVTVKGLAPGVYRYVAQSFVGSAPEFDGPWWYGAPLGGFTLRDGATTDAGPTALHVSH